MHSDLAATALSGLQKKNADMSYVAELCSAAERESAGHMKLGTKQLAKRKTEHRFHQFFSRGFPKVSTVMLPLLVCKKTKKVAVRPCSALGQVLADVCAK